MWATEKHQRTVSGWFMPLADDTGDGLSWVYQIITYQQYSNVFKSYPLVI